MKRPSSTQGERRPSPPPPPPLTHASLESPPSDAPPLTSDAGDDHDHQSSDIDMAPAGAEISRQQQSQQQRPPTTSSESMGSPALVTPHLNDNDQPTFPQQDIVILGADDDLPAHADTNENVPPDGKHQDQDPAVAFDDDFVILDHDVSSKQATDKVVEDTLPGVYSLEEDKPVIIDLRIPQGHDQTLETHSALAPDSAIDQRQPEFEQAQSSSADPINDEVGAEDVEGARVQPDESSAYKEASDETPGSAEVRSEIVIKTEQDQQQIEPSTVGPLAEEAKDAKSDQDLLRQVNVPTEVVTQSSTSANDRTEMCSMADLQQKSVGHSVDEPPRTEEFADHADLKKAVPARELTEAEKRGQTEDEYQADLLATGELSIKDLTEDDRKKLFRILRGKDLGKARSLVEPISWPERDGAPNSYNRDLVKMPLKWSRPTLQLSFTRKAAELSQFTDRKFQFVNDQSFICVPSNNITPHVTSLLLAQPFLTECTTLNVELLGKEGSGSLSDGYRGILRNRLGGEGRKVVVKITSPSAFQDGHWRFDYSKAKTRTKKEAKRYTHHLAALQGEAVPIFYGLWKMDRELARRLRPTLKTRPYRVYVAVLEDVGQAINTAMKIRGESLWVLDISYKRQILDLYHKLRSQGITHEAYKTVHIRYKGKNDLRLIDFEKAEIIETHTYAAGEVCSVCSYLLGMDNVEVHRELGIDRGAFEVWESADRYWWYEPTRFPDVTKRDDKKEEVMEDDCESDNVSTTAVIDGPVLRRMKEYK
ncbi:hypothetical protein IAU59_006624 [Kwoniella sp. CBS 9459]